MSLARIPMHVAQDTSLRVKILDACGLTCTFCHNEGTPVVVDNRSRSLGDFTTAGPSGRVSIYAGSNGATFLPATIPADDEFGQVLAALREAMELTEVHLTGGEPTRHPAVARLTKIAVDAGFVVGMTSNGEHGERVLADCAVAGLDRVNFAIFGTTAAELAEVQYARYHNAALAERKIAALKGSIAACETHGIAASATLWCSTSATPRAYTACLTSTHRTCRCGYSTPSTTAPPRSRPSKAFSPNAVRSPRRTTSPPAHPARAPPYRLPDGRRVFFKRIRRVRLPATCAGCRFNNDTDCQEGFYGVRLYYDRTGRYQVGVCIQRMDLCLPLDEFLTSPLRAEVMALREAEYIRLATRRAG